MSEDKVDIISDKTDNQVHEWVESEQEEPHGSARHDSVDHEEENPDLEGADSTFNPGTPPEAAEEIQNNNVGRSTRKICTMDGIDTSQIDYTQRGQVRRGPLKWHRVGWLKNIRDKFYNSEMW